MLLNLRSNPQICQACKVQILAFLDTTVTVMVTKSWDTWKDIKGSRKWHHTICRIYIDLEANT